MSFRFIFRGDLVQNARKERVILNLAKLFSVKEAELDGLFDGRLEFVRDNLDSTAAKSYLKLFKRAGAMGVIEREDD